MNQLGLTKAERRRITRKIEESAPPGWRFEVKWEPDGAFEVSATSQGEKQALPLEMLPIIEQILLTAQRERSYLHQRRAYR